MVCVCVCVLCSHPQQGSFFDNRRNGSHRNRSTQKPPQQASSLKSTMHTLNQTDQWNRHCVLTNGIPGTAVYIWCMHMYATMCGFHTLNPLATAPGHPDTSLKAKGLGFRVSLSYRHRNYLVVGGSRAHTMETTLS